VQTIFRLAVAVLMAVLFFGKWGILGAIGGFILGMIPILGPVALIVSAFI
jgi:hypothetical protein